MESIYQWTQLHIDFVSLLLRSFTKKNIRYFILRNYEELPQKNTGKDIDIVIEPHKYKDAKNILLQTMQDLDVHYYEIVQFDRMRCWYIMDDKKGFGMHVDIIENEVYKGFEFFRFDELYAHVELYKDFMVLSKPMDTIMLLVQNLVAYKCLKDKYRNTIRDNYSLHTEQINKTIIEFWGNKVGNRLINYLKRSDFDAIVSYSSVLEKTAMKNIFMRKPLYTIKNIAHFLVGKFYRIIWCPKTYWRFFAVEAPDGTGKTTFINHLILELQKYYVSDEGRFCVHHFRPSILPNLGAAGEKAGIMKQDKDFTNPHRAKPANIISSFIRMVYYWIDYVIGMPLVLRKEVQYGKYTIFDRYIYDFLVDPERSRINLPRWIRRLFTHIVIQPQIVFVLQADVEIIYKRKQELTKQEISKQLIEFQKFITLGNRVVFLDANNSSEAMVKEASSIIMCRFLKKI